MQHIFYERRIIYVAIIAIKIEMIIDVTTAAKTTTTTTTTTTTANLRAAHFAMMEEELAVLWPREEW